MVRPMMNEETRSMTYMKRFTTYPLGIALAALLSFQACQDEPLETFGLEANNSGSVSSIQGAGTPRKDGERLVMPLTVQLSAPAGKAFQVEIQERKSGVEGKSVAVRGEHGGTRDIKK